MMSSPQHRRRIDGRAKRKFQTRSQASPPWFQLFVLDHVKQGALRQMLMTQSAGTVCEIERQRHAVGIVAAVLNTLMSPRLHFIFLRRKVDGSVGSHRLTVALHQRQ
jgi:hypothetical protein